MPDPANDQPQQTAPPGAAVAPVADSERIPSLDTLRGVAVLGILVMNVYFFAMPVAAYTNPLVMGGTELHNLGTWFLTHVLFDQKFLSIFAMLFGAGIVLATGKAEAAGARPARLFYRRQFWLLVIGAAHGYLLWMGDIIFAYAVVGMIVYPLRRKSARSLLIIACAVLPVTFLTGLGFSVQLQQLQTRVAGYEEQLAEGDELGDEAQAELEIWQRVAPFIVPSPEQVQLEIDTRRGGLIDNLRYRLEKVPQMHQFMLMMFSWRVMGLMLIGMALMKLGIVAAARSTEFYRKMMFGGYALGLPLTIFSGLDLYAHNFEPLYLMGAGSAANYFGSVIVALGHIGMVMLLVRMEYLPRLMQRFTAVGRMALSNYLLHSVLLTTVFYGFGLGLYGTVSRFWQMGFVAAVIALQLFASPWWLQRFRFGPAEWLYRSLAYWRPQPMRRRNHV